MDSRPDFERRTRSRGPAARLLRVFYDALRFLGRHIRGFYAAILTYLSFAFIVFAAATAGFAFMADHVAAGATQAFDERALQWIESHRTDVMDHVMLEITGMGNAGTVLVLVLLTAVFLWETRHRLSVLLLVVAILGGWVANSLLKDVFDRPRPSVVEWGTEVVSASFPSGHAMVSTVAYGTIAVLVGRLEPTRALRVTTWAVAGLIIFLVGGSRMYLGVHYPSDVLAGWVGGLAWTALVLSAMTAIRYFAYRRPEVQAEERDLERDVTGEPASGAAEAPSPADQDR